MSKLWMDDCGDVGLQHNPKAECPSKFLGYFKWSQLIVKHHQHFIPTQEN